jgi:hypothetical protein
MGLPAITALVSDITKSTGGCPYSSAARNRDRRMVCGRAPLAAILLVDLACRDGLAHLALGVVVGRGYLLVAEERQRLAAEVFQARGQAPGIGIVERVGDQLVKSLTQATFSSRDHARVELCALGMQAHGVFQYV